MTQGTQAKKKPEKRKYTRRPKTGIQLPRSIAKLFPHVKDCVDARKSVVVSVTLDDCKKATPLKPSACALAQAAARTFDADGVVIGLTVSYIIKGDVATRYKTSDAVAREITSFDRHSDFAPGTYLLSAPSPSQRLGKHPERKKNHGGGDDHSAHRIVHKQTARVRELEMGST